MNKLPKIVTLGILTAITAVFWIFFSVYRIFTNKENTVVPKTLTDKLNSTLDTSSLDELETKYYSQGGEQVQFVTSSPKATTSTTPTATIEPSPTASESATATPTTSPEAATP